jgi:putative acetyltransferase
VTAGVSVRRYRPSDLDSAIAIYQSAIRDVASRDYDPVQVAGWSEVDRGEWEPWRLRCPTWIAEVDGVPAGFSDLEPDGHRDMMFVHARFQGRGVATALLSEVEMMARRLCLARIFTEASITARPFFEHQGFTVIAPQILEFDGVTFKNFRMEKLLA